MTVAATPALTLNHNAERTAGSWNATENHCVDQW